MGLKGILLWIGKNIWGFIKQIAVNLSTQESSDTKKQMPRPALEDFTESIYANHFEGFLDFDYDPSIDDQKVGERIRELIG